LARKEAINADNIVEMDKLPINNCSFWGVPFLVKECFELEGMPFTSGIVSRKSINGKSNAISIVQIQQNGGIVIASTNTSEGCMWHESFNQVYGRSYNPYDFGRTCGGSSGGCGSGIASCFAPIAITSDVGGSTRIPALYNGVFGHKPSGGLVSNDNTIPEVGNGKVNNYCQLGPMSKHAEDLW
jgi:fatty acid amide hydrolase 2